nr:LptF/LptG family permease [Prochlorococcus marinus]
MNNYWPYLIKPFVKQWRKLPLLDRWLLGELIPPLLFAISAFTVVSLSVGVMFDLVRQIVESGLPFNIAIQVFLLRIPGFLVLSFPMAMLMATLLAYSRLSSNSELKALRSLGVSTKRMIAPAMALALLITSITFIFNNSIVPISNRNSEYILQNSLGKAISNQIGEDIIFSRKGRIDGLKDEKKRKSLTHLFYAGKIDKNKISKLTLLDFSKKGYTQMIVANKALWNESKGIWDFIDGMMLTLSPTGNTTTTKFQSYSYPLGTGPIKIGSIPKDANDMTVSEALKAEQLYLKSGNIKEARRMRVRIQEKFTLPMACIVFGLIGSTLGAKPSTTTSRSQGFGVSVFLILIYYVLSFSFSSLGVSGALTPFFAAWTPVFLSLAGGAFLLKKAS